MARDDWFRRTTWTEADQADFWSRLKRSRTLGNKAQYLRIQAIYLAKTYPDASLGLLDTMLRDFPSPFELASAELQRGEIFLKQGKLEMAVEALKRSFAHEDANPRIGTQAWSVYGLAVVLNKLTHLYDEAERRVIEHMKHAIFPASRFHAHAILAIIFQHRRDLKAAVENARAALAEVDVEFSGFSRHPDVGLVRDPDPKLVAELKEIGLV